MNKPEDYELLRQYAEETTRNLYAERDRNALLRERIKILENEISDLRETLDGMAKAARNTTEIFSSVSMEK